MKFARIAPVSMMVVAMSVASFATRAQAQVKIATVNAARVFNEIQEKKALTDQMENDQKTLKAQDAEKQQHLKDLQAARDALKPDSPQYGDADKALLQAATEYEVWSRIQGATIQRNQKKQMLTLFNKITDAVAQVATQKGLDLVIAEQKPDMPENLDQITVDQLRLLINQRNVLFTSPTADISADVIAAMDAKFKSGK
jgi:Skp family chaperone for outer membrane proteins